MNTSTARAHRLPLLLAALASVVLVPASPASAVAGYGDVAADRYYAGSVQWSVENDNNRHNRNMLRSQSRSHTR